MTDTAVPVTTRKDWSSDQEVRWCPGCGDYAILNARVPSDRIGRAFSFHTFSGVLGGAIGPGLVLALASLWDWRAALMICGAAGAVGGAVLAQ